LTLNCVAVLIGPRPPTKQAGSPIDRLVDPLAASSRRGAKGNLREAAGSRHAARSSSTGARRGRPPDATHRAQEEIEIAGNRGAAQIAEAERLDEREVALAKVTPAQSNSMAREKPRRIAQVAR